MLSGWENQISKLFKVDETHLRYNQSHQFEICHLVKNNNNCTLKINMHDSKSKLSAFTFVFVYYLTVMLELALPKNLT